MKQKEPPTLVGLTGAATWDVEMVEFKWPFLLVEWSDFPQLYPYH